MTFGTTRSAWLGVLVIGILSVGCGQPANNPPPGGPGMIPAPMPGGPGMQDVEAKLPGGPEHAAAKKVYAANGCARCHKLGETGGGPSGMKGGPPGGPRMGMSGPELTKVGADTDHTKEWIAAHVRNAKSHKPTSRMPGYGPDKIGDADLDTLAMYLASLK